MKFLSLFLLALSVSVYGQKTTGPILDRTISIQIKDEKLPDVLAKIAREGSFSFSYNSSIISADQLASIEAENKTVREMLNQLFKGGMEYREKSNHLILNKVVLKQTSTAMTSIIVSGYVENAATGERVSDASVYDKKSITSVITDDEGYFRMRLDIKDKEPSIAVSKLNFKDTTVLVATQGNQYLTIKITPIKVQETANLNSEIATVDSVKKEELPMPFLDEPNVRNISDTIYRDIQVSILPFIGTNDLLSGNIINNYSINFFCGYSLGTREIELGFFVNIDRGDVSKFQIAGIGNLVGRNVYGLQASGFFNVNGGETKALQMTGFSNLNFQDFQGVQLSGLTNVNLKGADGVLFAGLSNFSNGHSHGVQIAGLNNFQVQHYNGSQFAGITNFAGSHITGSQISAVFNYGKHVHGTQIGLFNYADSLGGVPVGLVSYVRSGYHKLEVSADEIFYANLAFRTGVKKFYNILLAGIKPEETIQNNPSVWTFGYGIGMAPRLGRRLDLNVDLTAQHVNKGSFTSELSLLNKVHVGVDFMLARKFSIYGGVTLNGYLTNTTYTDYPVLFTNNSPSIFYENTFGNNTNLKMWWGAKIGLRFL
jgi:hypothetical protein